MTQEIITNTVGAGQARPRRRARKSRQRKAHRAFWLNVAKYVALTVAGILLFRVGAAYALAERGYKAIGGEVFALFLPVFFYIASVTVRDWFRDIKQEFQKEDNDHEETF